MRTLPSALVVALASGLGACGGGGGTTMVPLTGENGVPVVAQTNGAAQLADGMIELVQGFGEILDGAPAPTCGAGSIDVLVDDAPPTDVVSTGDSLTLSLHGCTMDLDGEFVTLDGSVTLDVSEVIDTPPDGWQARFTVTFGSLSMAAASDVITMNGRMAAAVTTLDGITYTTTVTTDLSVAAESGGETFSAKLSGFRSEETYDEMTGDYSRSFSGRFSSSGIGGAVDMETVVPFTGNGDDPPTAGESVIRGADASEVRLLALGGLAVRIFIDEDGDGTPENTVDTTWNDIG
jgi:hypothetical protein